jgi:hypothetical protein
MMTPVPRLRARARPVTVVLRDDRTDAAERSVDDEPSTKQK